MDLVRALFRGDDAPVVPATTSLVNGFASYLAALLYLHLLQVVAAALCLALLPHLRVPEKKLQGLAPKDSTNSSLSVGC